MDNQTSKYNNYSENKRIDTGSALKNCSVALPDFTCSKSPDKKSNKYILKENIDECWWLKYVYCTENNK